MAIDSGDRAKLADLAGQAFELVGPMVTAYCSGVEAPLRFGIAVYDASGAGDGDPSDLSARVIAEFKMNEREWGERNYLETAGRKVRAAVRTGRTTGDMARHWPDLFVEGDMKSPGGLLGEVLGQPVAIGTSGLRGTEDEPFGALMLEAMKRFSGEAQAPRGR